MSKKARTSVVFWYMLVYITVFSLSTLFAIWKQAHIYNGSTNRHTVFPQSIEIWMMITATVQFVAAVVYLTFKSDD